MSTEKLRALVREVSHWEEGPLVGEASKELRELRRMARVLVEGGVDYGPSSSGEFIEAVKLLRVLAEEGGR
jgi:hypothetical protein